jgi:hypothetical protein
VRRALSSGLLGLALTAAVACSVAGQRTAGAQGWFVPLTPSDGSAASGQVVIHENGRDQWMVMVMLQGLEPNSRRAVQIHNGSCSGEVLYPLEVMVADANGTGYSNTNLAATTPDARWWIQVSRDESAPEPGIACGQLPAS